MVARAHLERVCLCADERTFAAPISGPAFRNSSISTQSRNMERMLKEHGMEPGNIPMVYMRRKELGRESCHRSRRACLAPQPLANVQTLVSSSTCHFLSPLDLYTSKSLTAWITSSARSLKEHRLKEEISIRDQAAVDGIIERMFFTSTDKARLRIHTIEAPRHTLFTTSLTFLPASNHPSISK